MIYHNPDKQTEKNAWKLVFSLFQKFVNMRKRNKNRLNWAGKQEGLPSEIDIFLKFLELK